MCSFALFIALSLSSFFLLICLALSFSQSCFISRFLFLFAIPKPRSLYTKIKLVSFLYSFNPIVFLLPLLFLLLFLLFLLDEESRHEHALEPRLQNLLARASLRRTIFILSQKNSQEFFFYGNVFSKLIFVFLELFLTSQLEKVKFCLFVTK